MILPALVFDGLLHGFAILEMALGPVVEILALR